MILFELHEKSKHASFCFGRFNPPTQGHQQLINMVVQEGQSSNFFIFTSQSQDSQKNPLDYDTKVKFLKELYPTISDHIVHDHSLRTIMQVAEWLYNQGYRRITFIAGSDRLEEFKKLLDGYNGVDGKNVYYEFDSIDYVSSGERDPDAEGTAGISATDARNAAKEGNLQAFTQITGAGNLAQSLFSAVRKGMLIEAFDGINAQMNAIKSGLADVNKQVDNTVKLMASAEKLAVEHAAKHPEHAAQIQKLYQAFVNKLQRADDQIDVAVGYNAYAQKIKNESVNEEQLNELANNPYPFRLHRATDTEVIYAFKTSAGEAYTVNFNIDTDGYIQQPSDLTIEFVHQQAHPLNFKISRTKLTKAGDAFNVLSTVKAVITHFFTKSDYKNDKFASITMLADVDEPSRIKLYDRALPNLTLPGYNFSKRKVTSDYIEYIWKPNF